MKKNKLILIGEILSCMGLASSGVAATATVLVGSGGLVFVPATTNINVNDTVVWSWSGSNHSTTSGTNGVHGDDNGVPSGLWDSGVNTAGHLFTNTFSSPGTFSYYCIPHSSLGMRGTIIVTAASTPPAISITSPLNGTVLAAPASLTIQATASGNSGATVTNVQFLVGATVLTNEATPPFSADSGNLTAGAYTLSAVATDSNGLKNTNAVSINVVTPVAVSLASPAKLSPASFQFSYSADTGLSYVIQRSTNLDSQNWLPVATNVAASNPVVFVDVNATNGANFYRVGRLPNP